MTAFRQHFGTGRLLLAWGALLVILASCAAHRSPPVPPPPPPADARAAGIAEMPVVPLDAVGATRALQAFVESCPILLKRADASQLTRPEDWRAACDAARTTDPAQAADFFATAFDWARVGSGAAFVTGYYEPEIAASPAQAPGFGVPIYGRPPDLIEQDAAIATASGTPRRGRLENGVMIPYYERAEIEDGVLAGRGLEIAWAADPVDLFFLQIQGSGRLAMPDGSIVRIGYAGQNGRDYVAIGRLLKERGLLQPGQLDMGGIKVWLHAHPDEGKALMREDKSYVFFRMLEGPGPIGALGTPVAAQASAAADPHFVPLGAPVLLQLGDSPASGLWVAQDTGGAIKGANRFDTFWGRGASAAAIAGGLAARGNATLLLPKGTIARLNAPAQP